MPKVREPVDLIIAKGKKHLTKEEIEDRKRFEVSNLPNDDIVTPDYLLEELKTEFYNIAEKLKELNIISNLDNNSLARYVAAEHEYQRFTKELISMNSITNKYKEYLKMQSEWFKQARASASDLGLNITARCKLIIPKGEHEVVQSEEEKLFGDSL